jgi:multidrug efflux pump subunit AcrB
MNGLVRWFAANSVAANLLMVLILATGALTVPRILVEVFPELSSDLVTIQVPYPGATPSEVEESICVRIEEAIWDVEGVEEITSRAAEGVGTVTVEVRTDADVRNVLDDIKVRVDALDTLPQQAERPVVSELVPRRPVIDVAVYGDLDELTLRKAAERVRDELSALPELSQVELSGVRPYEVAIEVSEPDLRRYGTSFAEVAAAVRRSSVELPGGTLRTRGGEIVLRTDGKAETAEAFEQLILRTNPDGTRLLLSDVARVVDGFAETDQRSRFDGSPSAQVRVFRVGDQSAIEVAKAVSAYVAQAGERMPDGVSISTWQDQSLILRDRLRLMIENGLTGLLFVFVVLALFLRFRLAIWVALGIPISFLGALALLPQLGASINLISLFAYILVLGIVVDDAIVVGEAIHRRQQLGEDPAEAARKGALEVARPVVFAILTTVVAFLPMALLDGFSGKIWYIIPAVVIPTLVFSLIESLLILPAHLSHPSPLLDRLGQRFPFALWIRFQDSIARGLDRFRDGVFVPSLRVALRLRYATLAGGAVALALTLELIIGRHLRFDFLPPVEADNMAAQITMPLGTPVERTAEAVERIEAGIEALEREYAGQDLIRHWFTAVGSQPFRTEQSSNGGRISTGFSGAHLGEVNVELAPSEQRDVTSAELARRWRELVGEVPGAVELSFVSDLISSAKPIQLRLQSADDDELRRLTTEVIDRLEAIPGVYGISTSLREGKEEFRLSLRPEGEALGLRLADLAQQVRQAYYGEEAQRLQRGRDDLKVMVRYPESQRRSLEDVDRMRVRTAEGAELGLWEVARVERTRGASSIDRADRMRSIEVSAEVDETVADPNAVRAQLDRETLATLFADRPGARYSFVGEAQEQVDTIQDLSRLYSLALLGIFALMAIPFRSYLQPGIVMAAIPFGLVGAVGGHLLTGYQLSMISVLGVVALGGVVVNDSLVLVDFVNRERERHPKRHPSDSAIEACTTRFRPIILTSATTFAGLTPLMLERSVQAQFLVPMAISLAFGVAFATFITLGLVPSLYLVLEDLRSLTARLARKLGLHHEPDSAAR